MKPPKFSLNLRSERTRGWFDSGYSYVVTPHMGWRSLYSEDDHPLSLKIHPDIIAAQARQEDWLINKSGKLLKEPVPVAIKSVLMAPPAFAQLRALSRTPILHYAEKDRYFSVFYHSADASSSLWFDIRFLSIFGELADALWVDPKAERIHPPAYVFGPKDEFRGIIMPILVDLVEATLNALGVPPKPIDPVVETPKGELDHLQERINALELELDQAGGALSREELEGVLEWARTGRYADKPMDETLLRMELGLS